MPVVVMITVGSSAVEGLVQACSVHRSVARVVSIAVFFGSTCSCDLSVALTAIFICSVGSSGSVRCRLLLSANVLSKQSTDLYLCRSKIL